MSECEQCPSHEELIALASGWEGDSERLAYLEECLSKCESCRRFLEDAIASQPESAVLREVAGWEPEQEGFQPVFETAIDSSFRVARRLDLTDFALLKKVVGLTVSGSIDLLQLKELIGAGGMGAVFRAYDPELDREVAVKVLRPELAGHADVGNLFLDEARAAAALHHENVLPIYHVSRDESGIFSFAMPVIEGGSLDEVLKSSGGKLVPDQVIDIAIKMARALLAAHESGIIHRDVKPSNVLIEERGPGVWLADFGLARAASHGFGEGSIVGTPGYAAPEVMEGPTGTAASDLYSLGALLREMMTGKRPTPFSEEAERDVPAFSEEERSELIEDGYPKWFLGQVSSLLQIDPEQRTASSAVLLRSLESGREQATRDGITRESERATRARVGFAFAWVAIVLASFIGLDLLLGARLTNSVLRDLLRQPLSVDGSIGVYQSLDEILEKKKGDLHIRIEPRRHVEVNAPIRVRDRSISFSSKSGSDASLLLTNASAEGFMLVDSGALEVSGVSLRFRMGRFDEVGGVIRVRNAKVRFDDVLLRKSGGAGMGRSMMSPTLFDVSGTSEVVLRNSDLSADRRGQAFRVEMGRNERSLFDFDGLRFLGGTFFELVSEVEIPGAESDSAIEMVMKSSTVLATVPFLFQENTAGVGKLMSMSRNLVQSNGPYFVIPSSSGDLFRESVVYADDASMLSVSGPVAIGPNEGNSGGVASTTPEDAEAASENWETFWKGSDSISLSGTEWMPWILEFLPGRVPLWNEAVDRNVVGASFDNGFGEGK
ncbi:MAG: serine/threonine-protein kinase [Verrucomicrobiota bacterium]